MNIVPKLPSTVTGWYDARKGSINRTDNDRVEDLHLKLVENEQYQKYLDAYTDAEAIEGSMATDNVFAAQMIRNKAIETGDSRIAHLKIHTIVRCLGVVLRRYRLSRQERANMIGGVVVAAVNNNSD